jgi:hypothetical protein
MHWIPYSSQDKQLPAHKCPNGKEAFNTSWSRHGDCAITGRLQKVDEKMDSNPNGYKKYG